MAADAAEQHDQFVAIAEVELVFVATGMDDTVIAASGLVMPGLYLLQAAAPLAPAVAAVGLDLQPVHRGAGLVMPGHLAPVAEVIDGTGDPHVPRAYHPWIQRLRARHPRCTIHLPWIRCAFAGERGRGNKHQPHHHKGPSTTETTHQSPPSGQQADQPLGGSSGLASSDATTWIKWPPSGSGAAATTSPSATLPGSVPCGTVNSTRPRLALPRKWVRATISWPG